MAVKKLKPSIVSHEEDLKSFMAEVSVTEMMLIHGLGQEALSVAGVGATERGERTGHCLGVLCLL